MYLFGSGTLICTPFGANAAGNPTPLQLGTMQDVSLEISGSQKELFGKNQFPVAIARTNVKLNGKAKFANIYAKVLNDLFFGNTVVPGQSIAIIDEAGTPGVGHTVAVTQSAVFTEDLGVRDGVTGAQMTKVASAPAAGQYSVSSGVYTFLAADDTAKLISYTYTPTPAVGFTTTVQNKPMGSMPTFSSILSNAQWGPKLKIKLPACTATKLTLPFKNEDFSVPEFDFSAFNDAAGNIMYIDSDE